MLKESISMLLVEMLMMEIATMMMKKIPGRRNPDDYGGFERIEEA
jgi:hypothetical protein